MCHKGGKMFCCGVEGKDMTEEIDSVVIYPIEHDYEDAIDMAIIMMR